VKLRITVDGKVYEVDVDVSESEPPQPGWVSPIGQARVPAAPAPTTATPEKTPVPVADEAKVCRSPFAGIVSKVRVQVGQSIQVNDVLLVLEAMKMETEISAPVAGKVKQVTVKEGDAVQGGQVLVEFE
jgi:methylmalonyl-CoA carboxyltransferase small subunit